MGKDVGPGLEADVQGPRQSGTAERIAFHRLIYIFLGHAGSWLGLEREQNKAERVMKWEKFRCVDSHQDQPST